MEKIEKHQTGGIGLLKSKISRRAPNFILIKLVVNYV